MSLAIRVTSVCLMGKPSLGCWVTEEECALSLQTFLDTCIRRDKALSFAAVMRKLIVFSVTAVENCSSAGS